MKLRNPTSIDSTIYLCFNTYRIFIEVKDYYVSYRTGTVASCARVTVVDVGEYVNERTDSLP